MPNAFWEISKDELGTKLWHCHINSGGSEHLLCIESWFFCVKKYWKAVPKPGPLYGTHSGGEGAVTALFVLGFSFFFPFAFPGFPFLGFPLKHERGSGLHRCACRHGLLLVACPLVGLFSRSIPPPLEDYGAPPPTLEQTDGGLVNIHAKRCFSWRHLSRTADVPLIHSIRLVL